MTASCIFCDRLDGRDFWIPVAETEHSVAAVANHQRSTGSLIVVPRRHTLELPELSDAEALDLGWLIRRLVAGVEHAYQPDAMYVWQGGRIPLAHIHARICPRYLGLPYTFAPNSELALTPLAERQQVARRVRAALARQSNGPSKAPPPYSFAGGVPCPACDRVTSPAQGQWARVAESAHGVAFVPSRQPTVGTTLLLARRHVRALSELSDEEAADLWLLLRRLVAATMAAFEPPSYHVSSYVGALTGEPLEHLWWRLEPRYERPPAEQVDIEALPSTPVGERRRQADLIRSRLPT